jgi:hypothetical protein
MRRSKVKRLILCCGAAICAVLSGCVSTASKTNDTAQTSQTTSVIVDIIPTLQTEEIPDLSVNRGILNLNGTTLCLPTDDLPFDYQMAESL